MLQAALRGDVNRLLTDFGTSVDLLLAQSFGATDRFNQPQIVYSEPIPVLGHKVFGKNEEMRLLAQVPESVSFDATVTFASEHLRDATGRTSKDVLTITDRLAFDDQTWRVVATHYTGETRGEFLVVVAFVKSELGEYQKPALRP